MRRRSGCCVRIKKTISTTNNAPIIMRSSRTRRAGKTETRTDVIIDPRAAGMIRSGGRTRMTASKKRMGATEVTAKARYTGMLKTSTIQED